MIKKLLNSSKEYLILLIVVIIICLPFLTSTEYILGDDSYYHISNIQAIYTRMCNGGSIFEKILPIIANDYGYGSGFFYPQLSHIITAGLTYILQGNIIVALKIVHFIVYYLSALMMYKLINRVFKSKYVALIASVFYITFPYAITDTFTRVALAESFTFIFMPMIILSLYELFYGDKKSFYMWFIIGYVGMISTHLVMTMYLTIFVFIYLFIHIKRIFTLKEFLFKQLSIASLCVILLTLPFIVPLIQHFLLGEYSVFIGETMTHAGLVRSGTFFPWEFLMQKSTKRYESINQYFNLIALTLAIYTMVKRKEIFKSEAEKKFYKFIWIFFALALVFLTAWPWEIMPKFMLMIQYAWRIETMLVFATSILAGLALRNLQKRDLKVVLLAVITVFSLITVKYSYMPERFIDYSKLKLNVAFYGMGWDREYLPYKTNQNIEYFYNREEGVIIKNGNADIEEVISNTPDLSFIVANNDDNITVEIPRIYYLGYRINFTDENGKISKLQATMNENGFIEFKIIGNGKINIFYEGTRLEQISKIISTVMLITLGSIIIINKVRPNTKNEQMEE